MIKVVLFDIDGVLIDSTEANHHFYNLLFGKFFNVTITKAEYKKHHHLTMREQALLIDPYLTEEKITEIEKYGVKIYPQVYQYVKLNLGVIDVLTKLESEFKLGIVTNRMCTQVIDHFGISKYFEYSVTFGEVKNPKPNPEPLLLACNKFGVKPNEAVYIGDTKADAQAAKAAGMLSISYKNKEADADFHIDDLMQVVQILEKLNNSI